MAKTATFLRVLGEMVNPFRAPDFMRYIPQELRGLSAEQRAAKNIGDAFKAAINQLFLENPQLKDVETNPKPKK